MCACTLTYGVLWVFMHLLPGAIYMGGEWVDSVFMQFFLHCMYCHTHSSIEYIYMHATVVHIQHNSVTPHHFQNIQSNIWRRPLWTKRSVFHWSIVRDLPTCSPISRSCCCITTSCTTVLTLLYYVLHRWMVLLWSRWSNAWALVYQSLVSNYWYLLNSASI